MNNQNILKYRGTKLDVILDNSELYDYELVDNILGKLDMELDFSEFYDYKLGNIAVDYILIERFETIGNVIITDDDFIIVTEDNYMIEYNG